MCTLPVAAAPSSDKVGPRAIRSSANLSMYDQCASRTSLRSAIEPGRSW
jgi:hypothetical protein